MTSVRSQRCNRRELFWVSHRPWGRCLSSDSLSLPYRAAVGGYLSSTLECPCAIIYRRFSAGLSPSCSSLSLETTQGWLNKRFTTLHQALPARFSEVIWKKSHNPSPDVAIVQWFTRLRFSKVFFFSVIPCF